MPVSAAHPDAVKLDEAFAAAMDTPGRPREPGPPPEVDNDAPFGRGEGGEPLAPHGLTKDGKPRRSPAGRKPAEEKPRTAKTAPAADTPAAGAGPSATPAAGRYAPGIADTLEVLWLGGTVVADVGPKVPLVGGLLKNQTEKVHAQAAVLLTFKDQLAGAIDLAAQHNDSARKLAEKLSSGSVGWAMNCAFMILPFVSTSLKVWEKEPERPFDQETGEPVPTLVETLAGQNREALADYMAKIAAQAQAAAAQAEEAVPQAA
ncbi:MAG TPA: hypothetical protein VKU39_11290 [Streptosporangiaceae bacterium]|nr:hypothetical protein [Streptosporangiaceae bacterium]